jgi:hypothetical protein
MSSPDDPFAAPPYRATDAAPGYGPYPGQAQPAQYGAPSTPGQPYGGWMSPQQTSGTAIAALALAIGSFLVFPVVPAIIALVLARSASQDIDSSGGRVSGSELVTAARIVAWLNLGLSALAVVLFVSLFTLPFVL